MSPIGVIGDIHGNLEGLEAILSLLDGHGVSRILCVGDIVGYNGDSDRCIDLVRGRQITTIAGNHDLISIRRLGLGRCSNIARFSLARTRRRLSEQSVAWLGGLPDTALVDGQFAVVHGGVRDVQLYMKGAKIVGLNVPFLRQDFPSAKVCFFGHSHEQRVYEVGDGSVHELVGTEIQLSRERTYFINPGSVDAQRKPGYSLAECAVFDPEEWVIRFHAVPYDAEGTEIKARQGGYRIGPLTDRWYTLRRQILGKLRSIASLLPHS